MQTGVTHVIVMEGINDIGVARANPSPSADDLIAAHRQLIARAHARGLKIYGATLTPYEGAGYYSPEGEAKRQALNDVDPHERRIRRRHRLRRRHARPGQPGQVRVRSPIQAITCIPATRATKRWAKPSISPCSSRRSERALPKRLHVVRRQRTPRLFDPLQKSVVGRKRNGRRKLDARHSAAPERVPHYST